MKRSLIMTLVVVTGSALFASLVYAVLVAAGAAQPADATVDGLTARRLWATSVAALALAGVVVGGLALARPTSRGRGPGVRERDPRGRDFRGPAPR